MKLCTLTGSASFLYLSAPENYLNKHKTHFQLTQRNILRFFSIFSAIPINRVKFEKQKPTSVKFPFEILFPLQDWIGRRGKLCEFVTISHPLKPCLKRIGKIL